MAVNFQKMTKPELIGALEALQIANKPKKSQKDLNSVLHELRVHQIELEMQNRELREAQQALEESRNRYADLYDFAPIGYISLDQKGIIREANLTACIQLGVQRSLVLDKPFFLYVDKKDALAFRKYLKECRGQNQQLSTELLLKPRDGPPLAAQLLCISTEIDEIFFFRIAIVDITDRRLAEQKLRQSEEQYRLLFEQNPHPMWVYDPQTLSFLVVNEAAVLHYGYSHAEFLKMSIKDIRPPEDVPALLMLIEERKRLRRNKTVIQPSGNWRHRKRSGEIINVEITSSQISFHGMSAILVLANDITRRLQIEGELQEKEARYRELLESVPAGIYRSTSAGKFLTVNSALVQMLGYDSHEELLNVHIARELYFSVQERTAAQRDLRKGKKDANIFRLKKKDGSEIWVEDNGRIEYDEKGKPKYYEGVIRDITHRRQMEEALHHSEERFRDLFDNAPDLYIILHASGEIIDINQRGLKKLGYSRKQIVGKSSLEMVHSEDREKIAALVKEIQQKKRAPQNTELRLLGRDGRIIWMSNEFFVVKSPSGDLQTVRVVCRDITEKKQMEETILRTQRLETAGRVAGQIAHDFNNLLTPLTAYPPLIHQDLPKNHPVLGMIEEMQAAAQKIAEINQQLLALGRRGHYSFEPIDLNELVERTFFSIKLPKKLTVNTKLGADLLLIKGGGTQLVRALSNLIINAKEAMNDAGVLSITTENVYLETPIRGYSKIERGDYVKISISDNGGGIHPEVVDRIFEPFFSTKKMDRTRGSGLGLSIVHGIVEDHKGYITVDAMLGKGTTFSLFFPASREIELEKPDDLSQALTGTESILVIDDDGIQRRVLKQILERLGYKVTTVASGEEAVAHLRSHPQQLLIIDMIMEGIDGVETFRQILEFSSKQKAIILSGYAMTQRVQEALDMGAGMFISKPVIFKELAFAVRHELDK
jgi:PAS domain S-box-containing protein